MGRAPCCEKVGLKRGRWTAEEDQLLTKYIQANGEGSWRSLPKNAGLLRCGKSCRLRWINYLRADLKRGKITTQEEDTILKLHSAFGNRWSLIAAHLPGRTDNEIKNYWNSHLSRRFNSLTDPSRPTSTSSITPTSSRRSGSSDDMNIIKLAGSVCKPKGHQTRTRSRTIKKKSIIGLPKSGTINQVLDRSTAKEKSTPVVNDSINVVGETEIVDPRNIEPGLHGCCMDGSGTGEIRVLGEYEESSSSSTSNNNIKVSSCKRETESEVLGANEWLDSEIKRLHNTLLIQGETDGKENKTLTSMENQKKTGSGVLSINGDQEERQGGGVNDSDDMDNSNNMMMVIKKKKSGEICREISSSSSNYATDYLAKNSGFEFDDHDWDQYWADGGLENFHSNNNEWESWGDQEGDKFLCWLWDSTGVKNN